MKNIFYKNGFTQHYTNVPLVIIVKAMILSTEVINYISFEIYDYLDINGPRKNIYKIKKSTTTL